MSYGGWGDEIPAEMEDEYLPDAPVEPMTNHPEVCEPLRSDDRFDMIVGFVREERERQDVKWGADRDQSNGQWMLIAIEEIGEAAKAALEGDTPSVVDELTQAAAVIFAWLDNRIYDVLIHEQRKCAVTAQADERQKLIGGEG